MTRTLIYCCLLLFFVCITLTGCEEKHEQWYSVEVVNKSDHDIYACQVSNWQGYVRAGGRLGQGHRSTSGGIVVPVPNEVKIIWTTLKKGRTYKPIDRELYNKDKDGRIPRIRPYHGEDYDEHQQIIVLKGKVPENLFSRIFFTFKEGHTIEVSFVEEPDAFKDD